MLKHYHEYFLPPSEIPFGAMLLNCGHDDDIYPTYHWDGMLRRDGAPTIWHYTISGQGAIDVAGKHHLLGPGQAFLVRVPGRHTYYLPERSRHWEILYVTMKGRAVESLADFLISRYGNILNFPPESPTVRQAWLRVTAPEEERPNVFELSRFAYQFMLTLAEELMAGPSQKRETGLLARVNDYLATHPGKPLSVDALARAMNLSRSHFTHLFHAEAGLSPLQYILQKRLDLAAHILKAEGTLVKNVAIRCGFQDTNYFCRAFRKRFGLSPQELRRGLASQPQR